jgi:hypothetical protein
MGNYLGPRREAGGKAGWRVRRFKNKAKAIKKPSFEGCFVVLLRQS